jgi:hypothetical protein
VGIPQALLELSPFGDFIAQVSRLFAHLLRTADVIPKIRGVNLLFQFFQGFFFLSDVKDAPEVQRLTHPVRSGVQANLPWFISPRQEYQR